jgi:hypothetical protein
MTTNTDRPDWIVPQKLATGLAIGLFVLTPIILLATLLMVVLERF